MKKETRENIGWVDLLRIIACFLVLVSHSCDPFVSQLDADPAGFLTGAFAGSFVRACVPLFVMMTGVLLLPVKMETGAFYRKRIGRIVTPLVFWSLVLPILYYLYLTYAVTTGSPNIVIEEHTWGATWPKLYMFIFNFSFDTIPMWYLYMLIGLYLMMPVLSAWLRQASRKELEVVLGVWVFTLCIPYIRLLAPALGYPGVYGNMGLWGVCDWNEFGSFYYLSGFAGYLLLAYYLTQYPLTWSWKRTVWTCVPLFVAGYLITAVGFVLTQRFFPGNFANLEIIWAFCGVNVCMMTFSVFVLVQKMRIPSRKWLSQLASLTFGIYLCHFILVQVMYDLTGAVGMPHHLGRVLLIAIGAFGLSCLVAWVMHRFKLTRRFVA